jgi:phosphoglycolate phosphatase-like HAD superfamily hydrolase
MKLVMFDIDGTLTESNELDERAYLQALSEVFDFSEISSDWESYTHVTDTCILKEVCQQKLDRLPSQIEMETFQQLFLELLQKDAIANGGVKAISGAAAILNKLIALPDRAIAYAGGSWTKAALFKLKSAHLPYQNIPYAFSDDCESREGIMEISLQRAEIHYAQTFSEITYVGDGIWDLRATQNLNYAFVGIASGDRARKLFDEGATKIFANYDDSEAFLASLLE